MLEERQNSSFNLYRTILVSLCVNFNRNYVLSKDSETEPRSVRSEDGYGYENLKGETLRLTTFQKLPLSGVFKDENGKLRGRGIAFDVLHEIQKKFGFQYVIKMPEQNLIGDRDEGIIEMLKNNEVDMAVTFIPIMEAWRDILDYSTGLSEFEWVLFMARPDASASHSGLLDPFQEEVWICILISLIIAGPTMYLIAFYRTKLQKKRRKLTDDFLYNYNYNESNTKQYSLNACYWFVYGALMKQGSNINPIHDSPRLFFATWWIFITVLTSFYTANLTAFLTLSHFTLPIETTYDIYKYHYHWVADHNGFEKSLVNVDESFADLKKTIPNYGRFTNETLEERLRRIREGEIYISEKRKAKVVISRDYANRSRNDDSKEKKCTFVIAPKSISIKQMAFAYPKGSKFRDLLDPMLQLFVSAGIITHLLDSNLPLPEVCPLDLPSREQKLSNSDFITTYRLLFLGFGIAFIAFVGEAIFRCIKKESSPDNFTDEDMGRQYEFQNISKVTFVNESKVKSQSIFSNDVYFYDYYKEMMPYGYYNKLNFRSQKYRNFKSKDFNPENQYFQYIN